MSRCIKHIYNNYSKVTVPQKECDICIDNAFNPKLCRICRENKGLEIADGLKVCNECEKLYW